MNSLKSKLLSSTVIPVMMGAGIAVSGALVFGSPGYAFNPAGAQLNPIAKSRPAGVQLAQCNPCAPKKACNPCNPCAAKKACNPCNPCNPCGAGAAVELTPAEARAAYDCLKGAMSGGYAKAGVKDVQGYSGWTNVASSPYQSATHGNRYVNNYADKYAAYRYKLYEKAGSMPVGSVIAKDSFLVKAHGKMAAGPLFIMKKMPAGFSKDTGNWQYSMIMPNGKLVGTTNGKGSATVKFCAECHASVAENQDSLFFLPAEFRVK